MITKEGLDVLQQYPDGFQPDEGNLQVFKKHFTTKEKALYNSLQFYAAFLEDLYAPFESISFTDPPKSDRELEQAGFVSLNKVFDAPDYVVLGDRHESLIRSIDVDFTFYRDVNGRKYTVDTRLLFAEFIHVGHKAYVRVRRSALYPYAIDISDFKQDLIIEIVRSEEEDY